MTFDLTAIIKSKRDHRTRLAMLPIAEKLRLLDGLRARDVLLHKALPSRRAAGLPVKKLKVES